MINAKISSIDIERIEKKLKSIKPSNRTGVLARAMRIVGVVVANDLKRNISNRILKRRTGHLAKSIQSKVVMDRNGVSTVVGSGVKTGNRLPYADILERGGKIVPKKVKYLTIPIGINLTPAGVMRKKARQWEGAFFLKSGANLIMAIREGKGIKPIFFLTKKVIIPAKRYMAKTMKRMDRRIGRIIMGAINRGLSE